MHKLIKIRDFEFSLPHKICFENFNAQIEYGSRIAIIGHNGSGKSSLLKMIKETIPDIPLGYVPQIIEEYDRLSGGERFNAALSHALGVDPDVLLLDEPTNHLDESNRKSLMRMLQAFDGTLIIASHDAELLRNTIDTLWHIDQGEVHIFNGGYNEHMRLRDQQYAALEKELSHLKLQKRNAHQALMKEQDRVAKSKEYGQKKFAGDKLLMGSSKDRGEAYASKKGKAIAGNRSDLLEKISNLHMPEIIKPKFSLLASNTGNHNIVSVSGSARYSNGTEIADIHFSLRSHERLAITGDNGSGKTTILRALISDPLIIKTGNWFTPKPDSIGYLDQHYNNLNRDETALGTIRNIALEWLPEDIRRHLNDFLFRKNYKVEGKVRDLSGGERVRLSLAAIAAKTPKLLVLDEITNNLDIETKQHVIEVLREYPGAMIVVSHDKDFLNSIGINIEYKLNKP